MSNNKVYTAIIVDDTPQAISVLKNLLVKFFSEVKVVGEAKNVKQAVEMIKEVKPEIVFLDVEMPGEDGTAIFDYLDTPSFETIFTTAFPDYAAKAFRLQSIDYLVKPVKPGELKEAIAKVKRKYDQISKERIVSLPVLTKEDKITFSSMDSIDIVQVMNILYCEAESNYTIVNTDSKKIIVSKTLGYYENLLKPCGFFRVNRSHLVNLAKIIQIEKTGSVELTLEGGIKLPISGRRKKELVDLLESYTIGKDKS